MNKFYLSLVVYFCAGWVALAGPIDRKRASELASKFVHIDEHTESLRSAEQSASGFEPSYHIFNDSDRSGFVIVSGEEGVTPILGYSNVGQLSKTNMPEQLAELLRLYEKRILESRATATTLGQSNSELIHRPRVLVGPLLKSKWNQNAPYNDMAPIKKGDKGRAPTGCVATAMAQMMYFHKWPKEGRGSNTYTNNYYGELSADFSKSTYDWESMQDTYLKNNFGVANWNDKQAKAVAQLMYDAAISVNMQFTPRESGAYTYHAADALNQNFDYHIRLLVRDAMYNQDFVSGIKTELDSGNPVLMTGAGPAGGHAWVLDGYDENGFLHVNWGWGGFSDGYFELDFMNPPGLGIGGGAGRFNTEQQVILMRPRREGAKLPEEDQGRFSLFGEGMTVVKSRSNLDDGLLVFSIPGLGNWLTPKYKGELGVGLYSDSGELLHVFESSVQLGEISRPAYFTSAQMVTAYMTVAQRDRSGVHYFQPVCRAQRLKDPTLDPQRVNSWEVSGSWIPVARGNKIKVELDKGSVSVLSDGNTPSFSLAQAPEVLVEAWKGRHGSLRVPIKNESITIVRGQVCAIFERQGDNTQAKKDTLRLDETTFYDNTIVDRPIKYATAKTLAPGRYKVSFCIYTQKSGQTAPKGTFYSVSNPFGDFFVEVHDVEGKPILEYYPLQGRKPYELTLFHDDIALESDAIPMKQINRGNWSIGISLKNYGIAGTYQIRYRLMDMQTREYMELGEKSITLRLNGSVSNAITRVKFDPSKLTLTEDRLYRLVVEVKLDDSRWVDVWNASEPRRHLLIYTKNEKDEKDEEPKDNDEMHSTEVDSVAPTLSLKLYPNPTHHLLNVESTAEHIELYDMQGRIVRSTVLTEGRATLDVSALPRATYIAKLYDMVGNSVSERIMIL